MATSKPDSRIITGIIILAMGLILHTVGTVTPSWLKSHHNHATMGLFDHCLNSACVSINDPDNDLRATQILCITGIAASAFALLLDLIFLCKSCGQNVRSNKLAALAGCLSIFAGGFIEAGVIVFAVEVYDPAIIGWKSYLNSDYGYSFILTCVGAGLIFFGGTLTWIGANKQIQAQRQPTLQQFGGTPVVYQNHTAVVMCGPPQQQQFQQHQYQPNHIYDLPQSSSPQLFSSAQYGVSDSQPMGQFPAYAPPPYQPSSQLKGAPDS